MSATARIALRSSRVVLPEGERAATVVVEGESIAAIIEPGETVPADAEVLDFGDAVMGPGLVDAHVHVNEPGRTDWEGFQSATSAAAAGGVTTLIDMPLNSSPVTTSAEALEIKQAAAEGGCFIDVALYGGLVEGNANRVGELAAAGVAGIKAFLCDSGLDEFPASREADLMAAGAELARLGVPLLVHAELPSGYAPTLGDSRRYAEYLASRPGSWEADAIALVIRVSRETGCRAHIVHLANADALPMIEEARNEGVALTVETCPHYLRFEADQIARGDTRFKCAPPIRESRHREALWEALDKGLIDTIGSDHSPCPPKLKSQETGDFLRAWGGISGLELSLPVVWSGAQQRGYGVDRLFQWLSSRPAELFGLGDRKGKIAVGFDADLVVLDPAAEWRVDAQRLHHRHKLTPYEGERLLGRVLHTVIRGHQVFGGDGIAGQPQGELLRATFNPEKSV